MDNIIILNNIKSKVNNKKSTSIIEKDLENVRNRKFKEKFLLDNKFSVNDEKEKASRILSSIIKKIFCISDNAAIINLVNSVYNDGWDKNNTKVSVINEPKEAESIELAYDILFILENEYQKAQYKIVIKAKEQDNVAIIIFREVLDRGSEKIISFFTNKDDINKKNKSTKNDDPFIIMFCSNMPSPDVLEVSLTNNDRTFLHKFNVLKGWKYDLKKLYEYESYILFPMKIFDLEKRIKNMMIDSVDYENINYEINRFFRTINNYLRKLKEQKDITDRSIYEINMICFELLNNINNNLNTEEIKIKVLKEIICLIG